MKKIMLLLLSAAFVSGLALAHTNVSFKCYPDQYAYSNVNGWTGCGAPVYTACQKIAAQTSAGASYNWGCLKWTSSATEPETFRSQLLAIYGNGSKYEKKIGMTYNRFWHAPYWVAGQYNSSSHTIVVDYNYSERAAVVMHEAGHALGNCPDGCTGTYPAACIMGSGFPGSMSYCNNCRAKISAQYP